MTDYLEYTKGGYILIAPSIKYKHQYILNCLLCDEYFGEFEQFLSHCISHNDELIFSDKSNPPRSLFGSNAEVETVDDDDQEVDDCDVNGTQYENMHEVDLEDSSSMKHSKIIKEEDTLQYSDTYYRHMEVNQSNESQDIKSDDPENTESKDSTHSLYEPNSDADDTGEGMSYPDDMCHEDVGTDLGFSFHTTKSKDNKQSINEQSSEVDDSNEETMSHLDDMSCKDIRTDDKIPR